MGLPEDYEWSLTPEALGTIRKGLAVSVALAIGPVEAERVIEANRETEE